MSGILRAAVVRYSRPVRNATRGYADHALLEQTGRPPKLYVNVEKPPTIPAWEKSVAFFFMSIGALAYPAWVLYHIPHYKRRKGDEE